MWHAQSFALCSLSLICLPEKYCSWLSPCFKPVPNWKWTHAPEHMILSTASSGSFSNDVRRALVSVCWLFVRVWLFSVSVWIQPNRGTGRHPTWQVGGTQIKSKARQRRGTDFVCMCIMIHENTEEMCRKRWHIYEAKCFFIGHVDVHCIHHGSVSFPPSTNAFNQSEDYSHTLVWKHLVHLNTWSWASQTVSHRTCIETIRLNPSNSSGCWWTHVQAQLRTAFTVSKVLYEFQLVWKMFILGYVYLLAPL